MKPTRILLVLVRLAAAIVPFAVSSCYVTPPSVSFYPPPPRVQWNHRSHLTKFLRIASASVGAATERLCRRPWLRGRIEWRS
jgi:hypothetical protein